MDNKNLTLSELLAVLGSYGIELNNCPFCGEKAEVFNTITSEVGMIVPYYAKCKCGLRFSPGTGDLKQFIELWNSRKKG